MQISFIKYAFLCVAILDSSILLCFGQDTEGKERKSLQGKRRLSSADIISPSDISSRPLQASKKVAIYEIPDKEVLALQLSIYAKDLLELLGNARWVNLNHPLLEGRFGNAKQKLKYNKVNNLIADASQEVTSLEKKVGDFKELKERIQTLKEDFIEDESEGEFVRLANKAVKRAIKDALIAHDLQSEAELDAYLDVTFPTEIRCKKELIEYLETKKKKVSDNLARKANKDAILQYACRRDNYFASMLPITKAIVMEVLEDLFPSV